MPLVYLQLHLSSPRRACTARTRSRWRSRARGAEVAAPAAAWTWSYVAHGLLRRCLGLRPRAATRQLRPANSKHGLECSGCPFVLRRCIRILVVVVVLLLLPLIFLLVVILLLLTFVLVSFLVVVEQPERVSKVREPKRSLNTDMLLIATRLVPRAWAEATAGQRLAASAAG